MWAIFLVAKSGVEGGEARAEFAFRLCEGIRNIRLHLKGLSRP